MYLHKYKWCEGKNKSRLTILMEWKQHAQTPLGKVQENDESQKFRT